MSKNLYKNFQVSPHPSARRRQASRVEFSYIASYLKEILKPDKTVASTASFKKQWLTKEIGIYVFEKFLANVFPKKDR